MSRFVFGTQHPFDKKRYEWLLGTLWIGSSSHSTIVGFETSKNGRNAAEEMRVPAEDGRAWGAV